MQPDIHTALCLLTACSACICPCLLSVGGGNAHHKRELKRKCNNLQKVLRTGYANAGWEALACLFVTFPECKKF